MPDRPEKKFKTARELALETLLKCEKGKTPLTELIDQNLGLLQRVQRGFLTELCYGSTRMRLTLDWIIRKHSSRPLGTIDRVTREILRLGLYQVFFLTKVPPYAAVDESVKLAKKYGARQADRFVNAIMRNAAGAKGKLAYPDERKDAARHISVRYSHPLWLVKRWIGFFGVERTKNICQAGIQSPPMTIRANRLRIEPRALVEELEKEGVKSEQLSGAAIRIISSPGSLSRLDSFANGYFYIQDITSMEPALLLDPRSGESVLDLCSAPGGKTTHMAELMEDRGRIVSCDISHEKVLKLRANLDRLGITIAEPVVADVMGIDELFPDTRFDKALIDVPCSNTGVLRRRVEAKWRLRRADFERYSRLQSALIENAAEMVKPGGMLVYSTCSIDPAENDEVVQQFLKIDGNFLLEESICRFPTVGGPDGGFAAKLRKKD